MNAKYKSESTALIIFQSVDGESSAKRARLELSAAEEGDNGMLYEDEEQQDEVHNLISRLTYH